jgi:beta-glucosidase-like glycosyl hydrolase
MTLREKVGQLFSPAAFVHDSEAEIQQLENLIREHHIGGITFFHSRVSAAANFEKRQEVLQTEGSLEKLQELIQRYQAASKTPLLISIDAEYGLAMRIEKTPQYPYAITLGALSDSAEKIVYETGKQMGEDLKKCGIHLNLAPVADINTNPDNPVIGYRSFGPDKHKVTKWALAMYRGMNDAGIGACLKHFPGHGDTHVDSHLGLPVINKSKEELLGEELYPFSEGIKAGVEMIMVGHLAAPALSEGKVIPASISRNIITGLLKEQMGFDGLVISDALNMKSVAGLFQEKGQLEWEAFNAGNDILCFSEHIPEGIAYILQHASEEQILNSYDKIALLKEKLIRNTALGSVTFDTTQLDSFQTKLAENYLSSLKTCKDIHVRIKEAAAKGNLQSVVISKEENQLFTTGLEHLGAKTVKPEQVDAQSEKIISLFVPSAKPLNHFGMDVSDLAKLSELAKSGNCHLFLFGNPLALKEINALDSFVSITCCFQSFEATQHVALAYVKGEHVLKGELKLPFNWI